MKSPRITKKELGLLKGSMRRVFSRSELRRSVVRAAIVKHSDPLRPKVKTWCLCAICGKPEAISYMEVDHVEPIVKIGSSFEAQGLDETADRLWCPETQLQCVDKRCHKLKSKAEAAERKKNKKKSLASKKKRA